MGRPFRSLGSHQPGPEAATKNPQCIPRNSQRNRHEKETDPSPERYRRRIRDQRPNREEGIERPNAAACLSHLKAGFGKMDDVALTNSRDSDRSQPHEGALGREGLHRSREAIVDDIRQRDRQQQEREWEAHDPKVAPPVEEQDKGSQKDNQAHALGEDLCTGGSNC